jgi:Mg-chelatase subunit ChlD
MTTKITEDSTVEEVMMQLGLGENEELRESERRKMTLEKFAQLRSRNPQTTLKIENTKTAFVEMEEGVEQFQNITITSRPFEQKGDSIPSKYHDYLIQRAMTAHEVGHILYSSYPIMREFMDKVEDDELQQGHNQKVANEYVDMFQFFYNALEDGAIENFLSSDFLLGEELDYLRETIHEGNYFGKEMEMPTGKEYIYPFYFAVIAATISIGIYDNHEIDKLLDTDNDKFNFASRGGEEDRRRFVKDCLPLLEKEIPKIQSETNVRERTEKIYNLWNEVREFIDRSVTPGRNELQQKKQEIDGDSYMDGVPENLSSGHGEETKQPIQPASKNGEEENPGERRRDSAKSAHGDNESSNIEEKGKEGVQQEAMNQDGDWSEELEEIIKALSAGGGVEEIVVAEDGEVNSNRMKKAKNQSRRTSRLFSRRLRHMRKDKTVRNKERGVFDSRALIQAERGSTRCFAQKKPGNNKDYRCMIVLDRSGSMMNRIGDVELAAGAVAWGLEDNDVDTCIIDTEDSKTTLSKPFGTKTKDFQKKIFAGRCGGGTPLTGTLKFARQRMKRGKGQVPFMIVITDGMPRDTSSFKEELRKANFPVLGLYLNNNRSGVKDQLSLYDKAVVAKDDDDINQKLINLINKIVF